MHLFERDCSVQRRFQKVVEVAPSFKLHEETRQKLFDYALAITRHVNYSNAGTVEFIVDPNNDFFFIEVNARIQVEHPVTELVTGLALMNSLPDDTRGILTGISAEYMKKARGRLTAECYCDIPDGQEKREYTIKGDVRDSEGELVATVHARWLIGPEIC